MLRKRFDGYYDREFLIFDFLWLFFGRILICEIFFDNEGEFSGRKILEI